MAEITSEISFPEDIEFEINGNNISAKGKLGQVTKTFPSTNIKITKKDNSLILNVGSEKKRDKALLGTWRGHLNNMIRGVSEGITYKLKVVYSHFPMSVKTQGDSLLIENFLGERFPRKTRILDNVKIKITGQDIQISGADKDNVAQTAANIEQVTKIRRLDPRVFQDGIYIVEKDGKEIC